MSPNKNTSSSASSLWKTLCACLTTRARSTPTPSATSARRFRPNSRCAGKPLLKRTSLESSPICTPFNSAPAEAIGLPDSSSRARLGFNTKFNRVFTVDNKGLIPYIQRPSRKFPDVKPQPAELEELYFIAVVVDPAERFNPSSLVPPGDEGKVRFFAALAQDRYGPEYEPGWADFTVCPIDPEQVLFVHCGSNQDRVGTPPAIN
ncbi:hypothetical protein C8R43DRAFT_961579 [Mycena crocata]|nr:hypothetical protein C8R43DRAFT_961579 [Mycena crocata]